MKTLRIALLVLAGVSIACYVAITVAGEKYGIFFAAFSFSRGWVLLPACAAIPACVALGFRQGRKRWKTVTRAVITGVLVLVCCLAGWQAIMDGSLLVWQTDRVLTSPSGANRAVIAYRRTSGEFRRAVSIAPLHRGGWYRESEIVPFPFTHADRTTCWLDDNTLEVHGEEWNANDEPEIALFTFD